MEYFTSSSTDSFQLWVGKEGLDVYEEIHQNQSNRDLHVAFLPGVFYGTFMFMPAMVPKLPPWVTILSIMMLYTSFYATFDVEGAIYAFFFTLPSATMAIRAYNDQNNSLSKNVKVGLAFLVTSLVIQEVFGHYYYEEVASRMTASYITNAIMYSPLFYAKNIVLAIPPVVMNTGCLGFFSFLLYMFLD